MAQTTSGAKAHSLTTATGTSIPLAFMEACSSGRMSLALTHESVWRPTPYGGGPDPLASLPAVRLAFGPIKIFLNYLGVEEAWTF